MGRTGAGAGMGAGGALSTADMPWIGIVLRPGGRASRRRAGSGQARAYLWQTWSDRLRASTDSVHSQPESPTRTGFSSASCAVRAQPWPD